MTFIVHYLTVPILISCKTTVVVPWCQWWILIQGIELVLPCIKPECLPFQRCNRFNTSSIEIKSLRKPKARGPHKKSLNAGEGLLIKGIGIIIPLNQISLPLLRCCMTPRSLKFKYMALGQPSILLSKITSVAAFCSNLLALILIQYQRQEKCCIAILY